MDCLPRHLLEVADSRADYSRLGFSRKPTRFCYQSPALLRLRHLLTLFSIAYG